LCQPEQGEHYPQPQERGGERDFTSAGQRGSITGYGQTGPYRHRPGYDIMIEAQGGIMSITGPPDGQDTLGEPFKVGVAIVDITSGLYAVISILTALRH